LEADVELGGTDQRFNLLLGREIQKAYGLEPQVIVTVPLLEGTDGRQKMSKSLGNAIGIAEPAEEIFGKVMSISDELMLRYHELLTSEDTAALRADIECGKVHPMEAKKELAGSLAERFHGPQAAEEARQAFERRFQKGLLPDEVPRFEWPPGETKAIPLVVAMKESGLAKSTSDSRRLISQGAVRVNGERVTDVQHRLDPAAREVLLQVGSRRVCSIIFRA
jgi:tyrosyl-tRNA synthetase